MKANYGENRIANTETDELLKQIIGDGGWTSLIYKNALGCYYQVVDFGDTEVEITLSFISKKEADELMAMEI